MKSVLSLPNLIKSISMKFQSTATIQNPSLLANSRLPITDFRRSLVKDITQEGQDAMSVTPTDIRAFLATQKIDYKPGFTCYSVACTKCRNCKQSHNGTAKIFINCTTGSFSCTECTWSGPWKRFEEVVDAFCQSDPKKPDAPSIDARINNFDEASDETEEERRKTDSISNLSEEEFDHLQRVHRIQGITRDTLTKFGVRVYGNKLDLFIPRFHSDRMRTCGYKRVTVRIQPEETVITELIFPKESGILGLFGWNLVPADASDIIITSSEFDAMIIHQEAGKPVIALPKGISVLPVEALPLLEQFSKVILWMSDVGNRAFHAAKIFSRKLVEKRCYLISPELSDARALSAFQNGEDLRGILKKARPVSHKAVVTFGSFRNDVWNELTNQEDFSGLRWQRFPALNRILKGHRRGELTVLTGPTGAGKTTFLSEYSLDLCSQGLRTLWGSFEIRNSRLVKTMLNQFSRKSMQKNVGEFDLWADKFEQLSLYFMAFYGQESLDNVFDAMLHAVYVHDIEHVIVDNLQFMMGASNFKTIHDRIVKQDQMIEGFRRFASGHDCHVTLVVHPRKEMEGAELTAQSIYGGAKASQEADNILILQSNQGKSGLLQGKKYIQVVKNRFDGELGIVPLYFDKDSQSYVKKEKSPKIAHLPGVRVGEKKVLASTLLDSSFFPQATSEVLEEIRNDNNDDDDAAIASSYII